MASLLVVPVSPLQCNGHGTLKTSDRCDCWALNSHLGTYWVGADCSLMQCPKGRAWADEATAVDTAHADGMECSGKGTCDRATGTCFCEVGYEGLACSRTSCANGCSGHGTCKSMRRYAKDNPNKYTAEALVHYYYTTVWDADMMYGCDCDSDYTGYDCSRRICPTGDDPMTIGQVNEIQQVTCQGGDDFQLGWGGFISAPILPTASAADVKKALEDLPSVGRVTVTFGSGATACLAAPSNQQMSIEFRDNFGTLDLLTAYSYRAVNLHTITRTRTGTKENDACSGRGTCDTTTGICTCMPHFFSSDGYGGPGERGDCGYMMTPDQPLSKILGVLYEGQVPGTSPRGTIKACAGEVACSSHGVCDDAGTSGPNGGPTYKCTCSVGWFGDDCASRRCASFRAWFDLPTEHQTAHGLAECSNMGLCENTRGECECAPGYEGGACERRSCAQAGGMTCNGHGKCLSMAQLAEVSSDNGVARTGLTYGQTPNDARRWDHDMMHACKCDPGWAGVACGEQICPKGDDPRTLGQVNKQETFTCTAADAASLASTFTLSFRDQATAAIPAQATAALIKSRLEALSTVGSVTVAFSPATATSACALTSPPSITVTFLTETGGSPEFDLATRALVPAPPDMVSTAGTGLTLGGWTRVASTREASTCSDRGICNEKEGSCICLTGYQSSDGTGNVRGSKGDCSYVQPYPVEAE